MVPEYIHNSKVESMPSMFPLEKLKHAVPGEVKGCRVDLDLLFFLTRSTHASEKKEL